MKTNTAQNILVSGIRPHVPIGSHPIETGRYLIETNQVNQMYDNVCQCIENRSPGVIIYGKPRRGKTRSINYLVHVIPEKFGHELPIFLLNCRQYKTPKESTFFEDLLRAVGHGLSLTGTPGAKRDRLNKFLIEQGEASGQSRIILFIDDAQRLFEMQYNWLMDVYNELDQAGIFLTVILVGQEELLHQRSAFIQARKSQIVGRFMLHEHKFTGIPTIEDLAYCLAGYDDEGEFPVGSGWSFTKYYFPEAFENGFRLQNYAEELFGVFTKIRQEKKIFKPIEIPMQYIALTIEYALKKYGVDGLNLSHLDAALWRKAVEKSGYIESEIYQEIFNK